MVLEAQNIKGGISRTTPRWPKPLVHCLPPILSEIHQTPISSCSKGSRGLSVLLRVLGIFTETLISPSLSLRQRPTRCAIRAGRNLPDKEFRLDTLLGVNKNSKRTAPFLKSAVPACRHAAGTISSPCVQGVRRMASEDSDQILSGLSMVHAFRDFGDLDQAGCREMPAAAADIQTPDEPFEVAPL